MYVTYVMVVVLIFWGGYSILTQPEKQRVRLRRCRSIWLLVKDALAGCLTSRPKHCNSCRLTRRWLRSLKTQRTRTRFGIVPNAGALLGLIGILMAFRPFLLAMSGEESLAQVNRELEHPSTRT